MTCNASECKCGCNQNPYSELEPVLEKYGKVKGSLITILQKTQDIYGYIPVDAVNYIAERIKVKPAKIYGVVTFYAQFRMAPIGKNLILLCKGTACHVNGADIIEEAITEHLNIGDGETTADGIFTLNNVACLGCCSLAPVMMIQGEDGVETFGNLTKDSTKKILSEIQSREA